MILPRLCTGKKRSPESSNICLFISFRVRGRTVFGSSRPSTRELSSACTHGHAHPERTRKRKVMKRVGGEKHLIPTMIADSLPLFQYERHTGKNAGDLI